MKSLLKIPYYILILGVMSTGLLLLTTLVPIPGNFSVKIVKSGSMEPAIKTGGIVVIRPNQSYGVGDVITFGKDTKTQIPTTHRIVEVAGSSFITKGDANDTVDPALVKKSDVRGKVIFSLPYVGFILDFARKPLGFILLVGLPASLVILDEIVKIWKEIRRLRQNKKIGGKELAEDGKTSIIGNNVLDLRIKFQEKSEKKTFFSGNPGSYLKTLSVFLIGFLSLAGLSSVSSTVSYYNESETALANTLQASADYPSTEVAGRVLGESVSLEANISDDENPENIVEEENVVIEKEEESGVATETEETVVDEEPTEEAPTEEPEQISEEIVETEVIEIEESEPAVSPEEKVEEVQPEVPQESPTE